MDSNVNKPIPKGIEIPSNQYFHQTHGKPDNNAHLFYKAPGNTMNHQFQSISTNNGTGSVPIGNPFHTNKNKNVHQVNGPVAPQNHSIFTNNINQKRNLPTSSLSPNSNQLIEEINKLNPIEQQKLIQLLQQNYQSLGKSTPQNNYYQNEIILGINKTDKMDEEEEQHLDQKLININVMNQELDYKDCWDFYYSAIATIENIASGNSDKKEYGKWDEFNASTFKDKNQLVIQLLKILKNFKGAYLDYLKDYNGVIDYPENMDITFKKIQNWKKIIKDNQINKYLDELINIINLKSTLDFQKELDKYYGKEKLKKEDMIQGFESVMKCSDHVRKEEAKLKKEFEEKDTIGKYKVELNVPPGQLSVKNNRKYSYDKDNLKKK